MYLRQVDQLTSEPAEQLHTLYLKEWWSRGRELADVRRMLEGTDLIVAFVDESDRLLAFCRLLTDFVYHATLYDVIVDAEFRSLGLGRRLIDAVVEHPRLANVASIILYCVSEMKPFYEQGDSAMTSRPVCRWLARGSGRPVPKSSVEVATLARLRSNA